MIASYTEVHYEGTDREEVVVRYANGVTYVEDCIRGRCTAEAVEMVGPESLCTLHADEVRASRERTRAWAEAFINSPEGRREAAAERAWEARVS